MVITPSQLISKGLDPKSELINIEPLNFKDLLIYTKEWESAKTPLQEFLVDYNLVKKLIYNWNTINLIDLKYIIYLIKKESVSSTKDFTIEKKCRDCGKVNTILIDTSSILLPVVTAYDIKGYIVLDDKTYQYEVPSLEYFDKVLNMVTRTKKDIDLRLIYLISCFPDFIKTPNLIEDLVIKSTRENIIQLVTLESMYFNPEIYINHKCNSCNSEGVSMSVDSLIDNVFLCLFLSNRSLENKIICEQVHGS